MSERRAHDEACDWIVRLDSDQVTAAERSAFVRWLNQSPENAEAYQAMSRLWARMDALSLDIPASFGESADPASRHRPPTPWFLDYRAAVAASLAVVCLIVASVLLTDPVRGQANTRQFVTPVNATHTYVASDGSRIELGPETVASLDFGARLRSMELARGLVTLDVAHDAARPFTLGVGRHVITVLGTRFSVTANESGLEVRVDEGRVRFAARAGQHGAASPMLAGRVLDGIDLYGGQLLRFDAESAMVQVDTLEEEHWENQ